jgi:hypothetical protein
LVDEHQDVAHTVNEWKCKSFSVNISIFLFLIITALVWDLIENFVAPSWMNDDSDESEGT